MLSIKRQFITWLMGLIMIPLLFIVVFNLTAPIGLFTNISFYVFVLLGIIVALFPIEIEGATLFLITSVSIAVFLSYGLFAEMVVTTLATTMVMKRMGITMEESYRYPMNILLFQIVSILSAEVYYLLDPVLPSTFNFPYNLLSITIYLITSITLNRLLLYVLATHWQHKAYGNIINYEYIFSLLSAFYAIPIALTILYLRNVYSTIGIIVAAFPLVAISIIFKQYFFSDSQNRYLGKINTLAIKLNEKHSVNEIIKFYLNSWNNIFPADTIYYCTITEDKKIVKSFVYHKGHTVESENCSATVFFHTALEEYWFQSDIIVYQNSKEWTEHLHSEIDYPAESMLILPIKRAGSVVGFIVMTDPKRKAFSKNMLSVIPVLHNYLNIALENAYNYEELQINSRTDHLTGLSNLRAFEQHLNKYNQTNPNDKISIIIIDLDYFKDVNDSFGHQAGNELLKQIAILLSTFVYEQEKLARYGGEEFIFFIPNKTIKEIIELAENVRKKIEETMFNTHNYLDGRELVTVSITASIGVATYPDQCSSIKELMMLADRAMYVGSKQKGRNKVATINEGAIINETEAVLESDQTY
ncbi:sensor domain-containing diguanylate cyclase [Marinilactibacillus psychrotolerans]|uniref:Sensor domain-containing diguanylate cyclase n=1 Tax=Marinilactibacillus psychrotolerans TaxID=191770 RepID=A0ABW8UFR4_9LACT